MTEPRTQAADALWRLPVNARSHTSPLSPQQPRGRCLLLRCPGRPKEKP